MSNKRSRQNNKDYSTFRLAARIVFFTFLIILLLMPIGELLGFAPDYPDFIWTFNSKPRKIPGGTQKAVYLSGYSLASSQKRDEIYKLIEAINPDK